MRILLIESDAKHTKALESFFKAQGLIVETTDTGKEGLDLLRHYEFDLVVLSLTLADMDGSTVISRMRTAHRSTPVLAFARSSGSNLRLKALSAGADDVVDGNIDRDELVARMRAIVRRTRGFGQPTLQVGALTLDIEQQEVSVDGNSVHLTGKEFALLQLLVLRKNMVLTKEAILSQLYGGMDEPEAKIIDVFVCKLRSKLARAGLRDVIGTVWGRGYTVREANRDQELPQVSQIPERSFASPAFV